MPPLVTHISHKDLKAFQIEKECCQEWLEGCKIVEHCRQEIGPLLDPQSDPSFED